MNLTSGNFRYVGARTCALPNPRHRAARSSPIRQDRIDGLPSRAQKVRQEPLQRLRVGQGSVCHGGAHPEAIREVNLPEGAFQTPDSVLLHTPMQQCIIATCNGPRATAHQRLVLEWVVLYQT